MSQHSLSNCQSQTFTIGTLEGSSWCNSVCSSVLGWSFCSIISWCTCGIVIFCWYLWFWCTIVPFVWCLRSLCACSMLAFFSASAESLSSSSLGNCRDRFAFALVRASLPELSDIIFIIAMGSTKLVLWILVLSLGTAALSSQPLSTFEWVYQQGMAFQIIVWSYRTNPLSTLWNRNSVSSISIWQLRSPILSGGDLY